MEWIVNEIPHMKIGEIVETSTTYFIGQAYSYDQAPSFGSFVQTKVNGQTVSGVVTEVLTSTMDPSRKPMALGNEKTTLAETIKEHPQLDRLIHTYFKARITHVNGEETSPEKPPHLHEGVETCDAKAASKLTESFGYLSTLLDVPDDALSKHLQYVSSVNPKALEPAAQVLSMLLKDDYARLQRVLRRSSSLSSRA